MAERLRHLIVDQDEVGSTPIHRANFSGPSSNGRISGSQPGDASSTLAGPAMGVSSNWPGSLSFKQRMRDRDPPPLPVSGYKLCRRSTRLLIERAQFDSVMAHQVVPR